jgi:hypothetical protein
LVAHGLAAEARGGPVRRFLAALAGIAAVGCGYNCQDTCQHVYAASECNVATGQIDETQKIDDCIDVCQEALLRAGEVGDYDPYTPYRSGEQPQIENDKQAALWMECVWSKAPEPGYQAGCEDLQTTEGYCSPI